MNSSQEVLKVSLPAPGSYEVEVYYSGNPYVAGNYSNVVAVTVVESLFGVPLMMVLGYGVAAVSAYVAVLTIKLKRRKYGTS